MVLAPATALRWAIFVICLMLALLVALSVIPVTDLLIAGILVVIALAVVPLP